VTGNEFAYSGNNPVNYVDSNGFQQMHIDAEGDPLDYEGYESNGS